MTTSQTIDVKPFQFEYYLFKGGPHFLLCFHGYGEDAKSLNRLLPKVSSTYSILAINLPYHGKSSSDNEQEMLAKVMLKKMISELQKKYQFEEFSLFGYSLGAKIALQLIELFPFNVKRLILFAPDGIINNYWYNFAMRNRLTRYMFKFIIRYPAWFFGLVQFLVSIRIIPTSLAKFVRIHLQNEEKRKMVYNVWFALQLIVPDLSTIKSIIKEQQPEVQLFFGEKDKVIPPSIGHHFVAGIASYCQLTIVDCGHQMLTEKTWS